MNTITHAVKVTGAVLALSAAFFFGYSVIGFVADTFDSAFAVGSGECSGCGGSYFWTGGLEWHWNTHLDGGGGGGGGDPTPYCTLSIVRGPMVATSYPPQYQYTITWAAPYATQFSINNGIGVVTPPTGGTYQFTSSITSGTYTGTATTPYGPVTCSGDIPPLPPNPPYCTLSASPSTIASGSATTLTWLSTNGASFVINQGVGSVTPVGGGSTSVSPTVTTTYTGTVTSPQGATAQCHTTVTVTDPPKCELWIAKTIDDEDYKSFGSMTAGPDEYVTYTVEFKNTGGGKCTGSGVKVQDVLDARLTYISESHSTNVTAGYQALPVYDASTRTVSFNAWDLDPNESGWVKIKTKTGTPTACSEVVPNKAKITSYEYNNFGTWVYSNVVNFTLEKDCAPKVCELEITKAANVSTTTPGGQVEYTINVKNKGDAKCTGSGVKIQDVLDPMLTYVSETHSANITAGYQSLPVYQSSNRTLSWNGWDLDPEETGWIKVKVTAGTPSACIHTTLNKAKVTSYEYDNFGTWVYSNLVTVDINKNCQPPSSCSAGFWKNHLEIWYNANDPYDVQLLAWLNAQGPGSEALRNQARDYLNGEFPGVECTDTPPPTECKLEITKSTGDDRSFAPNENVEYTINVKNTGNKKCTGSGVKIQDVLDSRLTYVSTTHSSNITAGYQLEPVYQSATRTLSWNAWDLDPNETGWIKFVAKVGTPTACTETIPNKAKVTAYEYNNFGTWVESNTVDITVTKPYCYVQAPYCTMSIDPSSVNPGGAATITWNTTNVTSASIDQGIGSVALSGTKVVNPTANTTYTGTFTGPGGTVTCQASITVHQGPAPMCTLSVSASKIKTGQSVIVSWTSQNVSQGFINLVGTTTPVSGGSAEVYPSDSTTFTGTFTGSYGTVTCSAPVTVEKGTTGCQGNCGGGLNQPTVVMLQKPPEAPLAFVTLEQIPYTGFEAGKALTLAFWIAVGLLAAAVTYFVMGRDMIKVAVGAAPTPWSGAYGAYPTSDAGEVEEAPRHIPNVLESATMAASMPTYHAPTAVVPHVMPMPQATRPALDGVPELADVIEARAHGAGVLMSPEAIALALKLSTDRAEALRQFGEVLNEAVRSLPREDGWVMLTSERFEELSGKAVKPVTLATPVSTPSVEAILNSVMPPAAPVVQAVAANVEMPMANADDQAVVMSLAKAVLSGNREQAYTVMRNLEQGGAKAASVMTIIAGAYDQLYRARRHGLTTELSVVAMHVTDETLAKLVETFTHGMDAVYANPFTAVKLAVAQAFEMRG